jgi:Tfp pilus assembly protein PilF
VLGSEHPDIAQSLNNLAGLYRKQGKDEQAEPLFQRALAIDEKVFGPDHPKTKRVQENYSKLLKKRDGKQEK